MLVLAAFFLVLYSTLDQCVAEEKHTDVLQEKENTDTLQDVYVLYAAKHVPT